MINLVNIFSIWIIPVFIVVVIVIALLRRVNVFEAFVDGARESFRISVRLIPFLVGMLVAIGLFRDSGAMELLVEFTAPLFSLIRAPAEILPMAVMRPLSGSAALAMLTDILTREGPDSLLGRIASTMMGSTETTLYILTVYFGAIGINKTRHALPVGLLADVAGFVSAIVICRIAFG